MLDQSFSPENFRRIIDYENRKGNYLENKFFPNLEDITLEIRSKISNIKELKRNKRNLSPKTYKEKIKELYKEKKQLQENKEIILRNYLTKTSNNIAEKKFTFNVEEKTTHNNKKIYTTGENQEAFFALKQLQKNISHLYKIKQSNRNHIISQLKSTLSDNFPKTIIRTDIKSFYESIPRKPLIEKINNDTLLTLKSKKLIKQILFQYGVLTNSETGIPRGIGISAYLAELYMRDFDKKYKINEETIYYARYVDDIIIIISPKNRIDESHYLDELKDKLSILKLEVNENKTNYKNSTTDNFSFDYLGYEINISKNSFETRLTNKKLEKYKHRIKLSIIEYKKLKNEKKARKLLKKRLMFLTGNTRLVNNKRNAVVGIYFSNTQLTNPTDLDGLDQYLKNQLFSNKIKIPETKFSFKEGFNKRIYYKFSGEELKLIVKAWKYAPQEN
ncbi:antiviral reverse transcriptase Drt3a [Sessilibacter corallicola]|uniref:antiviral reverse transcriptase Drt3a n=1 Tax=Sessilibacter corallicola TaxID=2904075 RepID=UPI001E5AEC21|nr:hypothetical protein [Sessilibacter corallicola]